jgi:hypothetical protein
MQKQYLDSFAKEKATEGENLKLQAIIQEQAERIRRLASPLVTPEKLPPAAWPSGEPPLSDSAHVNASGGTALGWC